MRKRYSKEELEFIERQARLGINCSEIGISLGVSAYAIQHVLSRRKIPFCRNPLDILPGEIWNKCLNFDDLEVSTMGRFLRTSSGSLINEYVTTGGYLTLDYSDYSYSAHRLVAMTFIPNPENKPEVNHIDGIKTNNCVNNLEWVTPSENIKHSIEIGIRTYKSGHEHFRSSLTLEQIVHCDRLLMRGMTYEEVAKQYNVHRKTLSRHVNKYRRDTERSETIL